MRSATLVQLKSCFTKAGADAFLVSTNQTAYEYELEAVAKKRLSLFFFLHSQKRFGPGLQFRFGTQSMHGID
jgi:hypothetical protein